MVGSSWWRIFGIAVCGFTLATACSSAAPNEGSESAAEPLAYDGARGNRIADRALALWSGGRSRGLCLAGVGDTLESSGVVSPAFPRLPSAVAFDDWARANPGELARRGFERQNLDINRMPRGTIITWRPGQCGYHAQYGHIEIVADAGSTRACSDFCGPIRKNCGAPGMIVPVGGAAGGPPDPSGPSGGDPSCGVRSDKRLHCANRPNVEMHRNPWASSPVVNTLRSSQSWFECWFPGEKHAGGNTTWYWTLGDDNGNRGFVPGSALSTPDAFDANPSAHGLVKCGD